MALFRLTMIVPLAIALLALFASPLSAQRIGCLPDSPVCDFTENVIAGSALNVALRLPVVADSWRKPLPRIVLGSALSAVYFAARGYETQGQAPYGFRFDWFNFGATVTGVVLTEGVVALLKKL